MLTKSEREWLRNRKGKDDLYLFCKHCTVSPKTDDCYWNHVVGACPMYPDIEDALEFSERVAVKLAKHIHNKPLLCETNWDCPYWPQGKCAWCYLKAARIEVEEEMECK